MRLKAAAFISMVLAAGACAGPNAGSRAAGPAAAGFQQVRFVLIPGGKFVMGAAAQSGGSEDAGPEREVTMGSFEMSGTEITVEQYAECVAAGGCLEPRPGERCNWGVRGRERHPVNCVTWRQAGQYAVFKGARLPSEAEWEYAARGAGRNVKYPWGDESPTCDRAVMESPGGFGCGADGTMPVCSRPSGNSAQGLCDLAGNVWEWVQDPYHDSYNGAPSDSGAWESPPGVARVLRGGSYGRGGHGTLGVDFRGRFTPDNRRASIGFRIARGAGAL